MSIRKNRNQLKAIFDCGKLRQILECGDDDLSKYEIQMVLDAVAEKYHFEEKGNKI